MRLGDCLLTRAPAIDGFLPVGNLSLQQDDEVGVLRSEIMAFAGMEVEEQVLTAIDEQLPAFRSCGLLDELSNVCAVGNTVDAKRACAVQHSLVVVTSL